MENSLFHEQFFAKLQYGVPTDDGVKTLNEKVSETDIRKYLLLQFPTFDEAYKISTQIHDQLVGNPDYIDSHIILNHDMRDSDGHYLVIFMVLKDAETNPEIKITL